jgi:hypothetical protein
MKRITILLMACLMVPLLIGCARNTNSVSGSATGLAILTSFGEIVLGHANFHTVTSDLNNEKLTVTDISYYDAAGNILGNGEEVGADANALQNVQRTFKMTLSPGATDEEQDVDE